MCFSEKDDIMNAQNYGIFIKKHDFEKRENVISPNFYCILFVLFKSCRTTYYVSRFTCHFMSSCDTDIARASCGDICCTILSHRGIFNHLRIASHSTHADFVCHDCDDCKYFVQTRITQLYVGSRIGFVLRCPSCFSYIISIAAATRITIRL